MKRLCFLPVLLFLLAGCATHPQAPSPTETVSGSAWVSFDIYAINDLHGKLLDTELQPGVDELSTYLKQAQTENTILLSTGDMWQGTSESNLTNGFLVTEWMNQVGFAAMTMGGHEFDWGEEWVRQNKQLAQFPFLGINIYSRQTNQRSDYCESSLVVEIEGVQIGIIGAIGDCYSSIASEQTGDIYFVTGSQLTDLVKAESERLRSQGVDFVIYTIHDGSTITTTDTDALSVSNRDLASYYDTSLSDGYVDLVFEADSHYWYVLQDSYGVYHLQGGSNNNGLSHARVLINKADGEYNVVTAELIPSGKYSYLDDDPMVAELLEKYAEQIAPAARIVGINDQYRNKRALCQLVADLYCKKGVEEWGAQYDIVLGGGFMSCRSPGYLSAGQVSYSQLQSLFPFDNRISLCSIQGRDLISKFLETDHSAYYIKTTTYGESIRNSIDPDGTYYVVTDSYTANYAANRMTIIAEYSPNIFARDLVADYLAQENG